MATQCSSCGASIRPGMNRCVKCGSEVEAPQAPQPAPIQQQAPPAQGYGININIPQRNPVAPQQGRVQAKDPNLAAVLSCLIVGGGQVYNGEWQKGLGMFIGCILLWCIFLGWIINIWSIVDAYKTAKAINGG